MGRAWEIIERVTEDGTPQLFVDLTSLELEPATVVPSTILERLHGWQTAGVTQRPMAGTYNRATGVLTLTPK